MTTLAKIEANRRNAARSTGPRTADGKAAVARNATTHGIFSSVPVVPGESAEDWEAHRAGVVDSLAPVGLLEVTLAERAALLLWRLGRLARYEAEMTAAALEDAEVPPLPPPEDRFAGLGPPRQKTREEHLGDLRRELAVARSELAGAVPARDFLRSWPAADPAATVPFAVAESVLEAACGVAEAAEGLEADPPAFGDKELFKKIGLKPADAGSVTWTAEMIGRGLAVYAGYARQPAERFREAVAEDLDDWADDLARKVRRLDRESGAVARLLDQGTARKKAARLLPGDGRDERIAKYERHLHGLLTSTLHELERLQARRGGDPIPPPAVADLSVTVEQVEG